MSRQSRYAALSERATALGYRAQIIIVSGTEPLVPGDSFTIVVGSQGPEHDLDGALDATEANIKLLEIEAAVRLALGRAA